MINARDELKRLVDGECLSEDEAGRMLQHLRESWNRRCEQEINQAAMEIYNLAKTATEAAACLRGCTISDRLTVASAASGAAMERIRQLVSRKGYLPTGAVRQEPEPTKGRTAPVSVGILFDVSQILLQLRDTWPDICGHIERALHGPAVQDVLDYIHPILDPVCGDDEEETA